MIQMNLENRKRLTDLEKELLVGSGEGILSTFGRDMYTLLYLKWVISKTDRTWNCCSVLWDRLDGRCMCMYPVPLYGSVPLLFAWNYHNFANWLCPWYPSW